jgi:acetate kinase
MHFAPIHIPLAIELIRMTEGSYPGISQFACFDTAFHRTLPESAARLPFSKALYDEGIHRYGFHGLSYESIVYRLGADLSGRTVMAHLGNGASLAAVKNGQSIDTSMGLTPTGGILMASRSGDLDPGVLLFLLRTERQNVDSLERLVNHHAGLTAISGGKEDMRDLEAAAEGGDVEAELAIEMFCTSIRKTIAGYVSVLGGLDMLVFTGGIGEHSRRVRQEVCKGLSFLGVILDDLSNESNGSTISTTDSRIKVRVVPSEEDRSIARHCRAMLKSGTRS